MSRSFAMTAYVDLDLDLDLDLGLDLDLVRRSALVTNTFAAANKSAKPPATWMNLIACLRGHGSQSWLCRPGMDVPGRAQGSLPLS
jgi:hypothetical protein